jgi:SAM-dependent methyltransferase
VKHQDKWQPSKYVFRKGKLAASRNPNEVSVGSRLLGDINAEFYEVNLRQYARGKLLDLGCGKVPLFLAYKDYVKEITCVDWEKTLHKNEYVDFDCDLTKGLPFSDGSFDTILLSDVLEHIPQPEHLWREMSRILSVNGKIIMNVPFFYWLHEQPYDYYRYTEFALRQFVEKSGLKLVLLESIGGSPEIIADIFAKHLQFIPIIGRCLAIVIQNGMSLFIKTEFGRKMSKNTSAVFPFGYFMIAEKYTGSIYPLEIGMNK